MSAERPDQRAGVEGLVDERHLDGDREEIGDSPRHRYPPYRPAG